MYTLILTIVGFDFATITHIPGFPTYEKANTAGAQWHNQTYTPGASGRIEKSYVVADMST